MVITTVMLTLIMLMIWKTNIWAITLFFVVFGAAEVIYLSSVLYKFKQGGYLPLAFSLVLMTIMGMWHYVHKKRYMFELKNKVSSDYMRDLATNPNVNRVPGIGFLYSELVQGIPPIFPHFISNIPSIHSVLVFISIKPIPISKVAVEERFLFREIDPREYRMFRCVARYGYNDVIEEPKEFERQLVQYLKHFVRQEHLFLRSGQSERFTAPNGTVDTDESIPQHTTPRVSSGSIHPVVDSQSTHSSNRLVSGPIQGAEEEVQFIERASDKGVVYLLGEAEVLAEPNSSLLKKIVVNYAYNFIRKNIREGDKVMSIPRSRLLRVGMTYEI